MRKQKKSGDFLKRIVLAVLVSMPVFAAVFVVLQLMTGLDPSPYLGYLALPGAVELALTAALKGVERWRKDHNDEESGDES